MADDTNTPDVPDAEAEANKAKEKQAKETPAQRAKRLDKEQAEQQKAAGEDPDDDPKPLSQTDNADGLIKTQVGDKEFDLTEAERTQLNALPSRGTAVDGQGTERVILPTVDSWSPAQVEPDPLEVARLERVSEALEAKQNERLAALGQAQG